MKSFESGLRSEQIMPQEEDTALEHPEELLEMSEAVAEERELNAEDALAQERSVLKRFKGRAKQVASVLLLVSAFSAGGSMVNEVYAQEKGNSTKNEQVEKRTAIKEFTFKQFKGETSEAAGDFKMEFVTSDVEEVLKEQNIFFDNEKGTFELRNEEKVPGVADGTPILKFFEINGSYTDRVEVSVEQLSIPVGGGHNLTKKIVKVKSFNSDGAVDTVSITDGRITSMTTEKSQK